MTHTATSTHSRDQQPLTPRHLSDDSDVAQPAPRREPSSTPGGTKSTPTARSILTRQNVDLVESGSSVVYGPDHHRIGMVEQIFGGPETGVPEWLTVATSQAEGGGVLVPLAGARLQAGDVIIAYTDDQLRDAPTLVADDDLTLSDAARGSAHYARADQDAANA